MTDIGVLVAPEDYEERTRIVLDYTSRDFAAIRAQLVGLAKGFMPDWETAGETPDFGTLLLELFAYMGDSLHFYIDRTASEAFLGTAIRRQSILYIADQMGYTPIGQQAATVKLTFKLSAQAGPVPPVPGWELILPAGLTRVHNNPENSLDLVVFELATEIKLKPGDPLPDPVTGGPTEIVGYATEGISVTNAFLGLGQGQPNTDFLISEKGIVYGSMSITTLEAGKVVIWVFTDDLSLARPTQSVFTTYVDDLDLTHVVFGDNASGRIPPVGSEVYVNYRYGVGAEANDLAAGALTTLVPPSGLEVWGVEVTNPEAPLGGADPETVESMRYSIPRAAARIKHRAVTLNDYADLAMQVPGVAKSVAHGAVYTAVYVRVAPTAGEANDGYMDRLCSAVESYLSDKVMVGSTAYAEPRRAFDLWEMVYARMTVHVGEGYSRTNTRNLVEQAIRTALSFDVVGFAFEVTIGLLYRTALAVRGVEWVELTWLDTVPPTHEQELMLDADDDVRKINNLVNAVYNNELLIPKIEPTSVVEVETDFPDLEEEERTHDGLWVKAVGGLINT